MTGQTISHYKITERLGGGGMGVVYRALDTRLDRPVALKVLRGEAFADPVRKKRFVQEAKAASALNHPNIITIHDIGEADGIDFIAMEYVAGQTLDHLIARKGLPVSQTLQYAIQIADALATAHAAGIVHRDIKPANIMLTDKGLVKVLDFGLAKLTERADSNPFASTQTDLEREGPETEEGAILGTVAYMSPEQAEGKRVDARSDIFSFGSVLYEMVTGRRAFQGETKMSTLTAVMREEPEPISEVLETAPRDLEKIIARCLRKDPSRRFQGMADLKVALDELKEESDSGKLSLAPASPNHAAVAVEPWRRWAIPVLTGVVIAGGIGLAVWWRAAGRSADRSNAPLTTLTRLTSDSGLTTDPALSPDGKLLAYASDRAGEGNLDIWVQQMAGGGAVRLTRDEADESKPVFSPDGSKIAFRSERNGGGVYVMPALGAEEQRLIAEQGNYPRFSPDGSQVAYSVGSVTHVLSLPNASGMYIVPAAGGAPKQLEPDFTSAGNPIWFPDGKHLLFLGRRDAKVPVEKTYDWWVASLDGSPAVKTGAYEIFRSAGFETSQIIPGDFIGDHVIFAAQSGDSTNLWSITLAGGTLHAEGPPQRLTFGSGMEAGPSLAQSKLVFASVVQNVNLWSVPIDANRGKVTGKMERVTQGATTDLRPALSGDGNRVVFLSGRPGIFDVWVRDLQSGRSTAITATPSFRNDPILSPDGSKVAYDSPEDGHTAGYLATVGGRSPRKLCDDCSQLYDWSPDGNKILYGFGWPKRIAALDVSSGGRTELLVHSEYTLDRSHPSPDNRWVVFRAQMATNQVRLYVAPLRYGAQPVPESEWIQIHEGTGNDRPAAAWSPDGNLIYLLLDRDGFRCLWAQRLDAAKKPVGPPFAVLHSHRAAHNFLATGYGKSIAGGKFVFNQYEWTGNIWATTLVPH